MVRCGPLLLVRLRFRLPCRHFSCLSAISRSANGLGIIRFACEHVAILDLQVRRLVLRSMFEFKIS